MNDAIVFFMVIDSTLLHLHIDFGMIVFECILHNFSIINIFYTTEILICITMKNLFRFKYF